MVYMKPQARNSLQRDLMKTYSLKKKHVQSANLKYLSSGCFPSKRPAFLHSVIGNLTFVLLLFHLGQLLFHMEAIESIMLHVARTSTFISVLFS